MVPRRRLIQLGLLSAALCADVYAMQSGNAAATVPATQAQGSARREAPFDLTGFWVSIVTQNWRFRMVVPGPGEYSDIPINAQAKQFADRWKAATDVAAGKQCEAYGAAAIMRVPTRLRISWAHDGALTDEALKVETDAGMQTRLLRFQVDPETAAAAPSWQGYSSARWVLHPAPKPGEPAVSQPYGTLEIRTDHLLPGLLRKNGIPYGSQSRVTEYWELNTESEARWLTVTTLVDDPEYLRGPYITDAIFRGEADGSGWAPSSCVLTE